MTGLDLGALFAPLRRLADDLRADGAPAALVAVADDGRTASVARGVADLETGLAAEAAQTFDIASQTKMMTAVVVLQLVGEGRIALDAPAARWLPPAVVAGVPNADTATVRQLLEMSGGVPNYTEALGASGLPRFVEVLLADPETGLTPKAALDIARTMPADFAPGGGYAYSNTGYLLLGTLVEAVTGNAIGDAFRTRIFEPAGMAHTSTRVVDGTVPEIRGYAVDPETGERIDENLATWALRGEGGVISTAGDMIRFLDALLVARSLLGPALLAEMTAFREIESGPEITFSFGLGLARIAMTGGPDLVGFTGGTLGMSSSTYRDLATGRTVALAVSVPQDATVAGALGLATELADDPDWARQDEDGPLRVGSGSAASLGIDEGPEGVTLTLDGAQLRLARSLAEVAADGVVFADGSVLLVGSAARDRIDVARDAPGARWLDNQILGQGGGDRLSGGAGSDRIDGGAGDDVIFGGGGDDWLTGGDGGDRVHGGRGNDRIFGEGGDDLLLGGPGDDWLDAGPGDDGLSGGPGNDVLRGAAGADRMVGGAGRDTFVWMEGDLGADVIADFSIGADRLAFGTGFLAEGELSAVLRVEAAGSAGVVLLAETAEAGWQILAAMRGVDAAGLAARIADGTILDDRFDAPVPVTPEGVAEDGWDGPV